MPCLYPLNLLIICVAGIVFVTLYSIGCTQICKIQLLPKQVEDKALAIVMGILAFYFGLFLGSLFTSIIVPVNLSTIGVIFMFLILCCGMFRWLSDLQDVVYCCATYARAGFFLIKNDVLPRGCCPLWCGKARGDA